MSLSRLSRHSAADASLQRDGQSCGHVEEWTRSVRTVFLLFASDGTTTHGIKPGKEFWK